MEDNFWNPSVGTPQEGADKYDASLDDTPKTPSFSTNIFAPPEPVNTPQPQQQSDSGMWNPQGMGVEQQQEMQIPDLYEVGEPGIDYDMGHVEKIGKSLLVGLGDLFDSVGDIADFIGGSPSQQLQKQMFGINTMKPVSSAFHNFGEYLQSFGDDVPGLKDLEEITWDSLSDVEFWETGVARMLPFALSLLIPGAGAASAATRGMSLLSKGAKFQKAAQAIAAGGRSIGLSKSVSNALNVTRLVKAGAASTAAGATSNLIEGAALAGQTLNEAVAQGVDVKVARNAARQVYVDNLASMAADIAQWSLLTGQLKVGGAIAKGVNKASKAVSKTAMGAKVASGVATGTEAVLKAAPVLKNPGIQSAVKHGFKAIGMGAANGITDGVVEQFQEVYQDWSVQKRIAEAKGEEFVSYMDFFMADEQRPTRVLSFATSLLMSGVGNTINTAAENRHAIAQSRDSKADSADLLGIFNRKLDEGTYDFKENGELKTLNADKATALSQDTAARTMIQNAVVHGEADAVMEFFEAKLEDGGITQEQFNIYKSTLSEVQESVKNYPTQNLNNIEKAELVANAWLNNVTSQNLERQRAGFAERADEIQSLVDEGKQDQTWADKEKAGLDKAAEKALEQELLILEASSKQIKEVYRKADERVEQERFAREEGKQLTEIAEKELAGEILTTQEKELIENNKAFYGKAKNVLNQASATNKAAQKVGKREFKKYGKPQTQKDGSIEFVKENKDGSYDTIIVSDKGEVILETNKDDASIKSAEKSNKGKIEEEYNNFVDSGKVEKSTIERIAYKIKNNRGLTKEEEAMRLGAAKEIEAILQNEFERDSLSDENLEQYFKDRDTALRDAVEKGGMEQIVIEGYDYKDPATQFAFKTLMNTVVKDSSKRGKNIDPRINYGFGTKALKQAIKNLKTGKKTKALTRHLDFLIEAYNAGGIPIIEGTGGNRVTYDIPLNEWMAEDIEVKDAVDAAEVLSAGGQYSVKFLKALASAKSTAIVAKQAAKDLTKKTFTKENAGKIIDFLERAYMRRRINRAFEFTAGSENALMGLLSEKAADGLISVNGIINLAKQGPKFLGYAAGMSVFVNTDADEADEAFFHENFHIFRVLYGHLPEVQEMMKHIVNQPIYNKTKLDYQENILYSVPTKRKGEVATITQENALKLIKKKTGKIMATTIEEYAFLNNIEKVTADTYKDFYEESLEILTSNNYLELTANEQTNIQDEALTKLAGIYGSYNQDMFIADEDKRKAYNNSLKSWKEKISSAFTKEESDWSLEEASNNQYKKTDEFDFEQKFSQIKDLIAKEEAQYGNLAKESPSTVKIKALKEKDILSQVEKEMSNAESTVVKDAKAFYKTIEKDLLTKEELETATAEELKANREAMLRSSKEFRIAKQKFISDLLMNYTEGTQEYRDIRNVLRDNNKLIESYIKQAFVSAMSTEAGMQMQLFSQEEMAEMEENALVALINGEHQDISSKFYMHVREFIQSETYIGNRSDEVKSNVNKANIMYLLKRVQESFSTPMAFTQKAQEFIEDTQGKTESQIRKEQNKKRGKGNEISDTALTNLIILGDFFNYLQTEVDGAGNNIFSNVLLQFRSMTTDKGLMWDGQRFAPSISTQLRRKIKKAKSKAIESYQEEESIPTGSDRKESMKFINKAHNDIYEQGTNPSGVSEFEVWNNLKKRFNYSRRLVELLYGQGTIQEVELLDFINTYLLSGDDRLTENQFKTLNIKNEDGSYVPIGRYFSREKLEEMLWESVSISIADAQKENITLEEFQDRARIDVFNPIFKDYNINNNAKFANELGLEKNSLNHNGPEIAKLQETFNKKIKEAYSQEKFNFEDNKPYTVKKAHVSFEDGPKLVASLDSDYAGYFNKGYKDEEKKSRNVRYIFLRNQNNDVQELKIRKTDERFEVEEVKVYKASKQGSLYIYKDGNYNSIKLNDMKGVSFPISALLNAKIPTEDKSYLYTIRTPQGNQLNKNIRKYYLKYGRDAMLDYKESNNIGFLSLFTYGNITNPYAEKIASSEYELDYHSLDGDLVNDLDRDRITNREVSVMDITEIEQALFAGSTTYMQPVRDFSDKTRRYYSQAFVIPTEKEARAKLKELVEYHEAKTQQILDRHNDPNDVFDIHLVTSASIVKELMDEGRIRDDIKTANIGHTKKGQLNLLGKRAFELKLDGEVYDLSTYEGIEASTDKLYEQLGMMSPADVGLIGANYLINKFYLQDLSSSAMEERNYTDKNKRSTGFIANHDSSYSGERVEILMFEDTNLNQAELEEKIKVLAYEKNEKGETKVVIKELDLKDNPAVMDSASVITQEEADRLIAKHGNIVDVKGSFKLVGYGNNIDNKKIAGMFGQESNTFYAKGHTIVVNETAKGPFEAIYKALKAREKYYKEKGLVGHSVIAYADSGIKKGSIKGADGTPQNKLNLQEWGELVKKGDDAVNGFMNKASYDEVNDIYGYDGRFFGIQGELDKNAETATSSKQMVSGINVFKGHDNADVRAKAKAVINKTKIALDVQYQEEVKDLSREEILKKNAEADSVPTPVQKMIEDGNTSMPYMRAQLIQLLGRKVIKGAHKLRTGGTLSLQESDILYGYAEKAKEIVQTDERLLPMQVVEEKGEFKVNPAEAVISIHLAERLGITQKDLDKGKEIKFLATRIPSSSAGSTVVLKVKGIATKPGNTIAVSPLVSAIIGSDLDGDMLHINTLKERSTSMVREQESGLSKLDEARNELIKSIMDLYLTPEVQSSLTKEIEFESIMEAHNKELFGSTTGDSDVTNDLSMLGTHKMFGQTKGNAPMIAIIASQNLLYNYISEGNPNLFYNNAPIRVKLGKEKYSNLDNTIKSDGGGTWYTVAKWLNLILDDGKNNVRAKYLFFQNTANTFVMLLKMGVPTEKISSFIKRAGWNEDEFIYWKQPENEGVLEEELKELLVKEGGKESDSLQKLITDKYINDKGYLDFNLESTERVDHLAMYIAFDAIGNDTFSIGHHLSLDKQFEADPLLALEKHQAGITALENQTQPEDGLYKGIGNNLGKDNTLYKRNIKVNYEIISKFFDEDPYYTQGYREGLIGKHSESELLDTNGILSAEIGTDKDKNQRVISMFRDQEEGLLSEDSEANVRMAKAMHLLRMAVHSDIDIVDGIHGIYANPIYGIQEQYSEKAWEELEAEERFAITTQAVNSYLANNYGRENKFLDKLDYMPENEFIIKNGVPKRIQIIRFKPNMNKVINEIEFTEQVKITQDDFKSLPAEIKNFFVSYDFLTTGWGSNGNSLTPFFSEDKVKKINAIAEKVQNEDVSNFKDDLRSYVKKNEGVYKPIRHSSQEVSLAVNARRIAALAYTALYGNDGSLSMGNMFYLRKESIGLNDLNNVTTISDNQNSVDRVRKSTWDESTKNAKTKEEKGAAYKARRDSDKEMTDGVVFYSGVPEVAMMDILGRITKKKEKVSSNSDIHIGEDNKLLKVPLYEFDGTSYEGIGQEMDYDKYVSRVLPVGVKVDDLTETDKRQLEYDYKVYQASVKKVQALYKEVQEENIEDAKYSKDMSQEESDAKFKRNRDIFRRFNDILSHEKIGIAALSQGNLFGGDGKIVEDNIDEIAAAPLRRYLEYHFGNHIADKQIHDWQKMHGKDLGDVSDELRAKDISALEMVLSPGDFGKGKPAIAYINKNMKMTHMKYQRNIGLVTKEMNEKLENLFKEKFKTDFQARAAKLWLKYMPMGTTSITDKLFGNLVQITTGLKKTTDKDGNTTYRDISDIRINPKLVYKNGAIKQTSPEWKKLSKAEQEYLQMYVKFTEFYRDLVENKELYAYNRGGTYIPSITSSRWETLHKRGLFGVYYQTFKGDQDLADILVEDINPLTGDKETLDYFSWKSLYMYGTGEDILLKTEKAQRPTRLKPREAKSGIQRIEGLQRIKRKAQGYLDSKTDLNGDAIERKSTINQLMALESEEAMNRFNHKRSMTSSYLATQNMHGALRSYISLFMFQHGNAFRDGDKYRLLSWNKDKRAFEIAEEPIEDMSKERLAFTGFDDKKQEVDAAIANLGGGKMYDPSLKYGQGVKNKNAINYLQKVVKRGLINKERGFTFSDFESEAHITNFFVNWTMYVALGLNVPAAIGNVAIGKYNAFRQMGGGKMVVGESRYWGIGQDGLYDNASRLKARKMIEEFGILTYRAEEIAEGVGGSSLSSLIFWPMVTAENWIQQAAFLGSLTEEQWNSYYVDKNGDLQKREGAVGITQERLAELERDVINVQGRGYSETDVRMIQLYSLSNMTLQFKRWFPTFLRDRFGREDIDDFGTMRMGAYTAAADFYSILKDKGKQWNIREWGAELKKLPKHKQDAVMRYWRGTHGVMIVAMLLAMSSAFLDDDEKDTEAYNLLEKLLGDMLLIVNAPKLTYMANLPALNTFKNLNLATYHAVKGTEYQRTSKYGAKGDKKFVSSLAQLLPKPARQALVHKKAKKRTLR